MTKNLGYHASSEAAALLEAHYGSHLQGLTQNQRWAIVLVQAYCNLTQCGWTEAVQDLSSVLDFSQEDLPPLSLLQGHEDDLGIANATLEYLRFGPVSQAA
ncbi:hypothetical protein H6F43_02710 [Leptolyngbya sp. FACHB-36]|uniref:hypothetical protein n=1 Tax=Leptolyngbya sp. FACHB-36 TaxID=2692808 RepID=UPI0016816E25|nr:hypothetical protein [Leptolyngbya sp. FACHB-36]MBD2019096.1 hypothetical protein [Leptolyngbya sp. FACHB-36]